MKICGTPVGQNAPLLVIAGPCVIESEALCLSVAEKLASMQQRLDVRIVFKASFDKANRTSSHSYRGVGMEEGLRILDRVRQVTGLPVLTDIHAPEQAAPVAAVVDMLQTPAFLARQTDLIEAAAASGKPVNFKKAQFMAPADMIPMMEKARRAAQTAGVPTDNFAVCERGSSFGYNNLVVDMRSLVIMRQTGCPVIFDATHSVQLPGGLGNQSGGQREFVGPLARAAMAVGVDGLFMECHPNPDEALSDGPNAVPLDTVEALLTRLVTIREAARDNAV